MGTWRPAYAGPSGLSSEACADLLGFTPGGGERWRFARVAPTGTTRGITFSTRTPSESPLQALGGRELGKLTTRPPGWHTSTTSGSTSGSAALRYGTSGKSPQPSGGHDRGPRSRGRAGWGRSHGREATQREADHVVRPQRLVQGRVGTSGQPPGPPDRRPPCLHRHLPGAPLARRRAAPRADPQDHVGAVLRALRIRGLHRGPRAAGRHPRLHRGRRRRPAVERAADRPADQRLLAQ